MIVYDLSCANGHRFEGWFGSSDDFSAQADGGMLVCPICNSADVIKAPMAPSVGRKGNQRVAEAAPVAAAEPAHISSPARGKALSNAPMPPEVAEALTKLAKAQAKALKDSKWVGKEFASQSRAMHYGEKDHAPIHGEASVDEARALLDEGVAVAPLPFPVAPPEKLN